MDPIYKILESFRPLSEAENLSAYDQKLGGKVYHRDFNSWHEDVYTVVPYAVVPEVERMLEHFEFKPVSLTQKLYEYHMDSGEEYLKHPESEQDTVEEIKQAGSLEKWAKDQAIWYIETNWKPGSSTSIAADMISWWNQFAKSHTLDVINDLLDDDQELPESVWRIIDDKASIRGVTGY
jgi:hypothetical protein